jgi:hypothetical protein
MEGTLDIRRFAAGLLIIIAPMALMGMARFVKVDRTQDPLYSSILTKEYRTTVELLLYRSDDSKKVVIGKYGDGLPKKSEMKDKFPFRFYDTKILGVLPAGSVFKVKRVMEEGNTSLAFITYYATLLSSENESFVGKEVNPTFLTQSPSEQLRQFDPEYVEEVNK